MPRRRTRTKQQKLHDQARFWMDHGEKVRLAFICGGMVALATVLASVALR